VLKELDDYSVVAIV